jgi:hypothetical protein
MVKKGADVMNEEGIQELGDLFLVREIEGAVVGNPNAFQVHWSNLDYVLQFLALEDTISSTAGHACYVE